MKLSVIALLIMSGSLAVVACSKESKDSAKSVSSYTKLDASKLNAPEMFLVQVSADNKVKTISLDKGIDLSKEAGSLEAKFAQVSDVETPKSDEDVKNTSTESFFFNYGRGGGYQNHTPYYNCGNVGGYGNVYGRYGYSQQYASGSYTYYGYARQSYGYISASNGFYNYNQGGYDYNQNYGYGQGGYGQGGYGQGGYGY